jgi:hypothetical protein
VVPASTTSTVPPEPEPYVAIGESVMAGAVPQLKGVGVTVDAKENRGPDGVKNAIIQLRQQGVIGKGTSLIVQVGTNAPVSAAQFDSILAEVPNNVKAVAFMTVRAKVAWVPGNNAEILALPQRFPSVHIIDWLSESAKVELCKDGIHISCSTATGNFYANLLLTEFGLPTIK